MLIRPTKYRKMLATFRYLKIVFDIEMVKLLSYYDRTRSQSAYHTSQCHLTLSTEAREVIGT